MASATPLFRVPCFVRSMHTREQKEKESLDPWLRLSSFFFRFFPAFQSTYLYVVETNTFDKRIDRHIPPPSGCTKNKGTHSFASAAAAPRKPVRLPAREVQPHTSPEKTTYKGHHPRRGLSSMVPHWLIHDVEIVISLLAYSTCSISMILLNKLVIDTYQVNFPMGLLLLQNTCAVLLVAMLKQFKLVEYPDFDWAVVRKWLPLTVLFVAMLWTSMRSLQIMSVAVQTILKNLAIILTALGDSFLFGNKISLPMYGAFLMMVLGSYLGSKGDRWVTTEGLVYTFLNIFFTVAYVLYMKRLLGDVSKEIGRYGPVFYNNILSLPFLLPFCVMDLPAMVTAIQGSSAGAKVSLLLMVLTGSTMTFATFWCMKMTSPTTYSVTGALNKIPMAVLGVVIFGHIPTPMGWLGIVVALSGGVWYTWLNRPKPQPLAEPGDRRAV